MTRAESRVIAIQSRRVERAVARAVDPETPGEARKRAARQAAWAAERAGLLVRPDRCEWCRRWGRERLERHHFDYYQPLLILFLCPDCHDLADAGIAG